MHTLTVSDLHRVKTIIPAERVDRPGTFTVYVGRGRGRCLKPHGQFRTWAEADAAARELARRVSEARAARRRAG